MRDNLGLAKSFEEIESIASSVADNEGFCCFYFVWWWCIFCNQLVFIFLLTVKMGKNYKSDKSK